MEPWTKLTATKDRRPQVVSEFKGEAVKRRVNIAEIKLPARRHILPIDAARVRVASVEHSVRTRRDPEPENDRKRLWEHF